ncbi:MAG: hypothetical protein K2N23_08300 [Clostridia bacterium]|nr:hypothetical protein [Clostridia bacterium]
MKKLVSGFLTLFCVIGAACSFVGCGDTDDNEVDASDNEVDASIYSLESAYGMGLLEEDDLKSIACRQYECYEVAENPYAGAYTQQTELSAKAEKDLKYLCSIYYNKNNRGSQFIEPIEPKDVEIIHYYGTYEGNVVAEVNCGLSFKKHIGGVEFINDIERPVYVLHYTEYSSDSVTVTGRFYNVETACENGWLNEDDLKSLACYFYGVNSEENPYSGLYTKPEDKLSKEMKEELKIAYLHQIPQSFTECLDDASITKYYGTFSGNIVVSMVWNGGCLYPAFPDEPDKEIGGVIFKDYSWMAFYVYHTFA